MNFFTQLDGHKKESCHKILIICTGGLLNLIVLAYILGTCTSLYVNMYTCSLL